MSSPSLEAAGQGLGAWCAGIGEIKALLPGDMNITHDTSVFQAIEFPGTVPSRVSLYFIMKAILGSSPCC